MSIILTLGLFLGLIPAAIARSKGRSFLLFWAYGAALFIVAFIHSIVMKPVAVDGKRPGALVGGFGVAAMVFGVFAAAGGSGRTATMPASAASQQPEKTATAPSVPKSETPVAEEKEDLELLSKKGTVDEFSTTIEGRIRNNTNKKYGYVQVTFNLYNEAGDNVGTALANTNDLGAKETWKFKAVGFGSGGKRFKLSKITGF